MTCACAISREADAERLLEPLKSIGWHEFTRQVVVELPRIVEESHRHLLKAERTDALQLGNQIAAMHREAAELENRTALLMVRAAREALRERTEREDWAGVVTRANDAFHNGGGASLLRDVRARCIQSLYELEIPGEDAAEALSALAEVFQAAQAGLGVLAQHLDQILSRIENQRDLPRMGMEPASPLTGTQRACIALLGVAVAGSIYGCLFTGPGVVACILIVAGIGALIFYFGCLRARGAR